MTLHAGTAGWAYREWKPAFYPQSLPQSRWLEHYCTQLGACEINATHYRLQAKDTILKWLSAAPEGFRFATKAHRRITHRGALAVDDGTRDFMGRYLDSVLALGDKLGAILYQFPPYRARDDDGLQSFLESLPDGTPFAIEFRDESWSDSSVAEHIAGSGGTICISDNTGEVPSALPPGPIGYVRLRSERYSPQQRQGWLQLLLNESQDRDVYAFVKHEGIPVEDQYGGIGFAQWLVANA